MDSRFALFEFSMDENDNHHNENDHLLNQTNEKELNISSTNKMSSTKKSKRLSAKRKVDFDETATDKENSSVYEFVKTKKCKFKLQRTLSKSYAKNLNLSTFSKI